MRQRPALLVGVALLFSVGATRAQSTAAFPQAEPPAPPEAPAPPSPREPAPPPAPVRAPPRDQLGAERPSPPSAPAWQPSADSTADVASDASPRPVRFLPARLPFEEGDPIVPGYRVEERNNPTLITSGVVLFGISYLSAVALAASSPEPGSGWLLVPIAGPFVAVSKQETRCDDVQVAATISTQACVDAVSKSTHRIGLLVADGVLQLAGASLLAIGWSWSEQQLVREPALAVSTRVGPGELGASVAGQF